MDHKDIIVSTAKEYITQGPYSVTHKKDLEFTTDPHDYVSMGLYWWKNENGKYERRDGQPNPETRGPNLDRQRLEDLINGVITIAIAWKLTGDDSYAKEAANLLHVWFVDNKTKMNPHLEYAQVIPGKKPTGVGIIDTYDFYYLLMAIDAIKTTDYLRMKPLKRWFRDYATWLQKSKQGKREGKRPNNHGTSHQLQVVSYQIFNDSKIQPRLSLWDARKRRIEAQIDNSGSQPHESKRSISLYYHIYNLTKLAHLAKQARKMGIDLANHRGKLRLAYEYLMPYLQNQGSWPLQQARFIDPADILEFAQMGVELFNLSGCREYLEAHDAEYQFIRNAHGIIAPPFLLRKLIAKL